MHIKRESYNSCYSETMSGDSHLSSIPVVNSKDICPTTKCLRYNHHVNIQANSSSNCTITSCPSSNNNHANFLPYSLSQPLIYPSLSQYLPSTHTYHTPHSIMRQPSRNLHPPSIYSNISLPIMSGISSTPITCMPTSVHYSGELPPLSHPPKLTFINPNQPILEARDHDVLCGRGVNISHHPGNERFRSLITNYRDHSYCTSYSASEKKAVALEIIQHIQSLVPPGRFLKRDTRGGQSPRGRDGPWIELGEREAVKKTCQALRDCNRHDRHGYATGLKQPNDVVQQAQQVKETGMSNKQRASRAAAKQAAAAAAAAQANLKRTREILEQQPPLNPHHITNSSSLCHHHLMSANSMGAIVPGPTSPITLDISANIPKKNPSCNLFSEDANNSYPSYNIMQPNSVCVPKISCTSSSLSFASPIFHPSSTPSHHSICLHLPCEKCPIKKQRIKYMELLPEKSSCMSNSVNTNVDRPGSGDNPNNMHNFLFKSNNLLSQSKSHLSRNIISSDSSLIEHNLFKSNIANTTTTILSKNKLHQKDNIHSLHTSRLDDFNTVQVSALNFDQTLLFTPKSHHNHVGCNTHCTSVSMTSDFPVDIFPKDTIRLKTSQESTNIGFSASMASNLDIFKHEYLSSKTHDNPQRKEEEDEIHWPAPTSAMSEVGNSSDEGISVADVKFEGI